MKILFCGMKYEYGRPEWGTATIEYQNFYDTLSHMEGIEARHFAFDDEMRTYGRDEMNSRLIRQVEEWQPDLLFCVLFLEEIKKETIAYITTKTKTKTFNWFTDDHWRLPIYSRYWAGLFTSVGTTDSQAPALYASYGLHNVIKTQWAANPRLFFKPEQKSEIPLPDVTFVGKKYGRRGSVIEGLKNQDILAEGFGKGWGSGIVSHNRIQEIFAFSKININFTESPYVSFGQQLKFMVKLFFQRQSFLDARNFKFKIPNFKSSLQSLRGAKRRQIKARIFEVPATSGFLFTQAADNLGEYYEDGNEIVTYTDRHDLIEKCHYYLEHEQERNRIAAAGYKRTLREHTYEQRFREIFKKMGLG